MRDDGILDIGSAIAYQPELEHILNALRSGANLYYDTSRWEMSELFGDEIEDFPVLIISSRHLSDNWPGTLNPDGLQLCMDTSRVLTPASLYVTWFNEDFLLAIRTREISVSLEEAADCGELVVIWVTETHLLFDSFKVSDSLIDTISIIGSGRNIAGFFPDSNYTNAAIASFPPARDGEHRFVGPNGKPAYVLEVADCCRIDG